MTERESPSWSQRLQSWVKGLAGEGSDGHSDHPFVRAMEELVAVQKQLEADFQRERVERYRALATRIFEQSVDREAAEPILNRTTRSVVETGRILREFVSLAQLGVEGTRRTRLLQRIEQYLEQVVNEAEQALEQLFDARLDDLSVDLELNDLVRGARGDSSAPRRLYSRRLKRGERITLDQEFPGKSEFTVAFGWKLKRDSGRSPCVIKGRCVRAAAADARRPGSRTELVVPGRGDDLLRGELRLRPIPKTVDRVAFVLEIEGAKERGHDFSQVEGLTFRLLDQAERELAWHRHEDLFGSETAIVAVELYRRNEQWRLRVRNEGSKQGIDGLGLDG